MTLDLFAPGMTPLHRVGLAGLAMTLEALSDDPAAARLRQMGRWEIGERSVELAWEGEGSTFLAELLRCGLQVTEQGLIWFPALGYPRNEPEKAVALHNALLGTFLQHGKSRLKMAEREVTQAFDLDGQPLIISYKPVRSFAHRDVALDPTKGVKVKGWLYPGAIVRHDAFGDGAAGTALEERPAAAIALLFAPVASIFFEVHRPGRQLRYCVVLPEFNNLMSYSEFRRDSYRWGIQRLQVAGTSEAAARVLVELEARNLRSPLGVASCLVVGFVIAPWARQQKTRGDVMRVQERPSTNFRAFKSAVMVFDPRAWPGKTDVATGHVAPSWSIPRTPDLIAGNTLAGVPWWKGFARMWQEARDAAGPDRRSKVLIGEQGGLSAMTSDSVTIGDSAAARLVTACHEAWRRRIGRLSKDWEQQGSDFDRMCSREFERARVGFARCKNGPMLRQALTDFWVRSGAIPALQEGWNEILPFLGDRWQDGRDLALLALASYKGEDGDQSMGALP
jgi:CRISPR-associated protein Cas8a1/Csx13